MEGRVILAWIEQALGVMVMFLVLLDVFLTVLYARAGAGVISHRLAFVVWRFFLGVSKHAGRRRGDVLSFCGPGIVVTLLLVWALVVTCGAALIIHPHLGTSVTTSSGSTPTDFITALFAGGSSMSLVGAGDFSPQTRAFRLFYLCTSLVGTAVISLTVSYLLQVYSGLRQSTYVYNSTGHHHSDETFLDRLRHSGPAYGLMNTGERMDRPGIGRCVAPAGQGVVSNQRHPCRRTHERI